MDNWGQGQRGRVRDPMLQVLAGGNLSQQSLPRAQLTSLPPQHLNSFVEPSRRDDYNNYANQNAHFRSSPYPAATPPTAIPSLSSGQGFYTVESLQGATLLPSAIPAPTMPEIPSYAMGHPVGPVGSPKLYPSPMGPRVQEAGLEFALGYREVERGRYNGHPGGLPDRSGPLLPAPNGPGPAFGWPLEREAARERSYGWERTRELERERDPRLNESQRFQNRGAKNWRSGLGPQPQRVASPPPQARQSPLPNNKVKKKLQPQTGPGGAGWCGLCEVECNTADMLQQHLAGKRHRKHVQKLDTDKEEAAGTINGSKSNAEEHCEQTPGPNEQVTKSSEEYPEGSQQTQQVDKETVELGKRSPEGLGEVHVEAKKPRVTEENSNISRENSFNHCEPPTVGHTTGVINLGTSTQPVSIAKESRQIGAQLNAVVPTDGKVVQPERDKTVGSVMLEEDMLLSDMSEVKSVILDVAVKRAVGEKGHETVAQEGMVSIFMEKLETSSET